jgi:uncharacterized protein YkwD
LRDARPAALSLAVVLGLALGAHPAAAKEGNKKMIRAINDLRASHGVGRLKSSAKLERSAESYSDWMAATGFFGHRPRHAYVPASRISGCFGEIIAQHSEKRAMVRRTVRNWAGSPPHRKVMLDRRYDWVGAGRARGLFGGSRATVWTVQVGCSSRG